MTIDMNYSQNAVLSIEELEASILCDPLVLSVRSFKHDDIYVFAVLTTPIYLKSERDELIKEITDALNAKINDCNVLVTFNMTVYRNISDDMSQESKIKLIDLARSDRTINF